MHYGWSWENGTIKAAGIQLTNSTLSTPRPRVIGIAQNGTLLVVVLAISPSVRRPISREVKVCQGFTNCCHSRRNLGLEKYASSSSKKRPRDAKENLPSWKNNESSCLHVFYDPKKRNCPLTRSLDKWLSVKIRIACNMLTFIFLNCRIFRLRLGFFYPSLSVNECCCPLTSVGHILAVKVYDLAGISYFLYRTLFLPKKG